MGLPTAIKEEIAKQAAHSFFKRWFITLKKNIKEVYRIRIRWLPKPFINIKEKDLVHYRLLIRMTISEKATGHRLQS